jgi:hypothetical protein
MQIKYFLLLLGLIFMPHSYAAPTLTLCIDGHCKTSKAIIINNDDWHNISEVFTRSAHSAQQERKFIAQALALIEQASLNTLAAKTVRNLSAENLHARMNNRDQALNYKSYIALLLDQQLLHYHLLRKTQQRASWFGLTEYATIIQERANGELYALDAYNTDFSKAPLITPLKTWKNKKTYKRLMSKSIRGVSNSTTQFNSHDQ